MGPTLKTDFLDRRVCMGGARGRRRSRGPVCWGAGEPVTTMCPMAAHTFWNIVRGQEGQTGGCGGSWVGMSGVEALWCAGRSRRPQPWSRLAGRGWTWNNNAAHGSPHVGEHRDGSRKANGRRRSGGRVEGCKNERCL